MSVPVVIFRLGACVLLSLFWLSCAMEALDSGLTTVVSLKLNRWTRSGKVVDGVANEAGHLQLNVLDNSFFSADRPNERAIFVFGSSVAVGLPQVRFRYAGHSYRMYNFAMTGNSVTPEMKIFAMMSSFHPSIALFGLTPSQTERDPAYDLGDMAFGNECLGILRKFKLPGTEFPDQPTCDLAAPTTRPFSVRNAFSNFQQLLAAPFGKKFALTLCRRHDPPCIKFADRFQVFRSLLASVGHDIINEARLLARYSPQREHIFLRDGPLTEIDLGDLTKPNESSALRQLDSELAAIPNAPNPNPHHATDAVEHWEIDHPNAALRPGGVIHRMYAGIARLARLQHISLVFYNDPLDYKIPGFFPPGYYQAYREALRDFTEQQDIHYLDEGDLLAGKGSLFHDPFHLNTQGASLLVRILMRDLVVKGYLPK